MKNVLAAEAISKGGCLGTIQTSDRSLNVTLGNPLEKGVEKCGSNPELLFAANPQPPIQLVSERFIGCFANPWAFQANTPDAARHESPRPIVSRNRIYLLK
jgi:hypothetical protein